jgi:FkbM family methyltransferase
MSRRSFENLIHRKLLSLGWRVQRNTPAPQGWEAARAYWYPPYIRRLGFAPSTLIDVGVARGTPDLYNAFPNAHLLLVEPVAEFSEDIAKILAQRPGVHFPVALGAEPGEREIRIEPRRRLLTSFYNRHELERTEDAPTIRSVAVETLDRLMAGTSYKQPFGLKIDAEGSELDIVRGASATLRDTEFVIAEVSILPRFEGGCQFAGFIAELDARGFEVCDILDIGRADSSRVTFTDLMFKRKGAAP